MATQTPIVGKIGDIKLSISRMAPSGFLSLGEGTLLKRSAYSDFWNWVTKNCTVISDTEWQSQISKNGTCAYFSSGDGSSTFRLPKINCLIKAGPVSNVGKYTPASYTDIHYHGLGKYDNNNGTWGRYSYTNAEYPKGTTGWFWNGSGGAGTATVPDTDGDTITSYNISISKPEIIPESVNLCLYIRYTTDFQETASESSLAATQTAINNLYKRFDSIENRYNVSNNLSTSGWQIYSSGLTEEWGKTSPGEYTGKIVYPLSLTEGTIPFSIDWSLVDPSNASVDVSVKFSNINNTSMSYTCTGILAPDAYIMWNIKSNQ